MNMPTDLPGNKPHAFHLRGPHVRRLRPVATAEAELPPSLFIPPGRYRVHGRSHVLRQEGLYRFLFPLPAKDNQQRIVYRRDPEALISAVCWLASHGSRDNARTDEELVERALTSKLICTCGRISQFCVYVLLRHGIAARVVNAVSLEEANGYDMGHCLMEARLNGAWVLIDVDLHQALCYRGRRLSLLEAVRHAGHGTYHMERLAASAPIAVGGYVKEGYDYGLYMETCFHDEGAVRRWYRRIMQVPIIEEAGVWHCMVETRAARRKMEGGHVWWLRDLPVQYLDRQEFTRKFYPE